MKKILLVEDNAVIRFSTANFLRLNNFEVLEADNGATALQLAKEELPDLLLCDINLPKLDGYGVLQTLRQNSATSNISFVFLTSETCTPTCRRALQLGANDCLTKPVNNSEILEALALQFNELN